MCSLWQLARCNSRSVSERLKCINEHCCARCGSLRNVTALQYFVGIFTEPATCHQVHSVIITFIFNIHFTVFCAAEQRFVSSLFCSSLPTCILRTLLTCACSMSCLSHWLNIVQLQVSLPCCFLLRLRCKYRPQHPVPTYR